GRGEGGGPGLGGLARSAGCLRHAPGVRAGRRHGQGRPAEAEAPARDLYHGPHLPPAARARPRHETLTGLTGSGPEDVSAETSYTSFRALDPGPAVAQ